MIDFSESKGKPLMTWGPFLLIKKNSPPLNHPCFNFISYFYFINFINKKLSILLQISTPDKTFRTFFCNWLKSFAFILNLLFTTFHFTHIYFDSIEMPSILSTTLQNERIKSWLKFQLYCMDSFYSLIIGGKKIRTN